MPKTLKEDVIYTIMMVICMVYAMVCYNIAVNMGGMSNIVFVEALKELPIMGVVAFLLEFFLVGHLSKKIAFKMVDPKEDKPIFMTIGISVVIVCFMCLMMSLIGTLLFNNHGFSTLIPTWLQTSVLNFPMALCSQLFYIGPFVRFVFKKMI